MLNPDSTLAIGVVIASFAVAVGAAVSGLLLSVPARDGRRGRRAVASALRRGIEVTAVVGLLLLLRVVDGLTAITGGFIVLGFVVAEVILSARPGRASR